MWNGNFCVWILLWSLALFLASKVTLVYEDQWAWREGRFYSACTIASQRKQCSLLYYAKKKSASDTLDADSDEGSGNAFSSHCFKWTLLNVQETEVRPAACRSVVLLFCSTHTIQIELSHTARLTSSLMLLVGCSSMRRISAAGVTKGSKIILCLWVISSRFGSDAYLLPQSSHTNSFEFMVETPGLDTILGHFESKLVWIYLWTI